MKNIFFAIFFTMSLMTSNLFAQVSEKLSDNYSLFEGNLSTVKYTEGKMRFRLDLASGAGDINQEGLLNNGDDYKSKLGFGNFGLLFGWLPIENLLLNLGLNVDLSVTDGEIVNSTGFDVKRTESNEIFSASYIFLDSMAFSISFNPSRYVYDIKTKGSLLIVESSASISYNDFILGFIANPIEELGVKISFSSATGGKEKLSNITTDRNSDYIRAGHGDRFGADLNYFANDQFGLRIGYINESENSTSGDGSSTTYRFGGNLLAGPGIVDIGYSKSDKEMFRDGDDINTAYTTRGFESTVINLDYDMEATEQVFLGFGFRSESSKSKKLDIENAPRGDDTSSVNTFAFDFTFTW